MRNEWTTLPGGVYPVDADTLCGIPKASHDKRVFARRVSVWMVPVPVRDADAPPAIAGEILSFDQIKSLTRLRGLNFDSPSPWTQPACYDSDAMVGEENKTSDAFINLCEGQMTNGTKLMTVTILNNDIAVVGVTNAVSGDGGDDRAATDPQASLFFQPGAGRDFIAARLEKRPDKAIRYPKGSFIAYGNSPDFSIDSTLQYANCGLGDSFGGNDITIDKRRRFCVGDFEPWGNEEEKESVRVRGVGVRRFAAFVVPRAQPPLTPERFDWLASEMPETPNGTELVRHAVSCYSTVGQGRPLTPSQL